MKMDINISKSPILIPCSFPLPKSTVKHTPILPKIKPLEAIRVGLFLKKIRDNNTVKSGPIPKIRPAFVAVVFVKPIAKKKWCETILVKEAAIMYPHSFLRGRRIRRVIPRMRKTVAAATKSRKAVAVTGGT